MSIDGYVEAGMRADCRGLRNEVRHRQKNIQMTFSVMHLIVMKAQREILQELKEIVWKICFLLLKKRDLSMITFPLMAKTQERGNFKTQAAETCV